MKKILILVLFFIVVGFAKERKAVWNMNQEQDLAGYKLYLGNSGEFSRSIDVGLVTEYVFDWPFGSDLYAAVTAYDSSGNESEKSVPAIIIYGDCNGDGHVDIDDRFYIIPFQGMSSSNPLFNAACDLNNDNFIDIDDRLLLIDLQGRK